ncbi:hypothetical protein AVEN_119283-1 [Araneus ventricosus]|uniref:Uncharacterized protein n=1 Tax=Araneus ventricosus TaxID=182803 RepID=A0A4Y2EHT3_ARAVE|nr:hypothetical protein AVEN_119283-1 [Araneus ventricosus]
MNPTRAQNLNKHPLQNSLEIFSHIYFTTVCIRWHTAANGSKISRHTGDGRMARGRKGFVWQVDAPFNVTKERPWGTRAVYAADPLEPASRDSRGIIHSTFRKCSLPRLAF